MTSCNRSVNFQIRTFGFWIAPAIEHDQIAILFDRVGKPRGYFIWAHLADDTEKRLLTDPNFFLHPSEWNEGGRTWIIDFCFPYGVVKEAAACVKYVLSNVGLHKVSWVRRNQDYSIKKIMRYRPRSSTGGLVGI
ncbi:TPA: toxin-activating lysine-acyltransferase [Pseudomonas putida]|nr:toxin-activating lysine-acyltransferase [Pseudomonas putida]